jgi:hypothetical protein
VAAVKTAGLGAEGTGVKHPRVWRGGEAVVTELEHNVSYVGQVFVLEVTVAADKVVVGDPGNRTSSKGGPGGADDSPLDCRVPLLS